jgi:hypothetical protein
VPHQVFARESLSLLCLIQGVATLAIDLNKTHATNPNWVRHARFHVVWQTFSVAILSAVELALIWMHSPLQDVAFYLAVLLAAISPVAFLVAWATQRAYGGALSDPNGISPVHFRVFGASLSIDLNVVAVCVALISLVAIVAFFRT